MSAPPNLLFIMTDQQRADSMACYGNDWIQTPTLNALARDAFVFERAYCAQPVCTPSRGTILSGLFPHAHGAVHNRLPIDADVKTLAQYLPPQYHRAYIGKWHLGDEMVPQHGFDQWVSICDNPWYCSKPEYERRCSDYFHFLVQRGHRPPPPKAPGSRPRFGKVETARLPAPETCSQFVADQAVRLLRDRHADRRPFVAYLSFVPPHNPFFSRLDDLYDPAALPVDSQYLVPPTGMSRRTQAIADRWDWRCPDRTFLNQAGDDLSTEAGWRRVRARYFALVTLVDQALASVFATLRETGLDRNTIVVFTSDHGDMMGDHRMMTKGVFYEQSARVPLLMRVPALRDRHRPIAGRVGQVDLVPTLLDLLGVQPDRPLHGKSLCDVLRGESTLEGNDVVIEWENPPDRPTYGLPGRWRSIISDGWKLNVCPEDRAELHDLRRDPQESVNLIDDRSLGGRVDQLLQRLLRWQHRTGDDLDLSRVQV